MYVEMVSDDTPAQHPRFYLIDDQINKKQLIQTDITSKFSEVSFKATTYQRGKDTLLILIITVTDAKSSSEFDYHRQFYIFSLDSKAECLSHIVKENADIELSFGEDYLYGEREYLFCLRSLSRFEETRFPCSSTWNSVAVSKGRPMKTNRAHVYFYDISNPKKESRCMKRMILPRPLSAVRKYVFDGVYLIVFVKAYEATILSFK